MAGLKTRFQSLPVIGKQKDEILETGEYPLLDRGRPGGLPKIKSAPVAFNLPGSGEKETPLPALLEQMTSVSTASDDKGGMKRLATFQAVRSALSGEQLNTPASKPKPKGGFGRLATRLKTVFVPVQEDEEELYDAREKKAILAELSKRTKGRSLYRLGTFQAAMNIKGEEFAGRLFHALDVTNQGAVTDEQLVNTLLSLKHGTLNDKIAFIWSFVANDSTCITRRELQALLKASCSEGELRIDDSALEDLAASFFNKAGKPDSSVLSLEDFKMVLESRAELRESLQVGGLGLTDYEDHKKNVKDLPFWERTTSKTLAFLRVENPQLTGLIVLMLLGQIAGFIAGFIQNDHGATFAVDGWSYPVAKGAARSIQVILIIFPFTVARSLLTLLRRTFLHHFLPLDEHISLHKHLAYHFFFWSAAHTIPHLINGVRYGDKSRHHHLNKINPATGKADPLYAPYLTQAQYYRQPVEITGVMLIGIMTFCYIFAVQWPFLRERQRLMMKYEKSKKAPFYVKVMKFFSNFEAFYYTHIFMAISVLVLLILHPYPGPVYNPVPHRSTTWVYLVGGTFVYILERIARIARQLFWTTSLIGVKLHKGGVTELRLQKPRRRGGIESFPGKAGQYCFINIPTLATFEWHPFSLTSAPHDDYISFHIRALGDWTRALYNYCEGNVITDSTEPSETHLDSEGKVVKTTHLSVLQKDLKIYVDGPFGAPAQDHTHFDCLVCVGAGIGATPFASILRQLLDEYNRSLCSCCKTVNRKLFGPRKVYFYWIVADQSAPQYFKDTLEEITALDTANFFDISIYLSKVKVAQSDLRVTIAKVAQLIQHEEKGYDALSMTYQPVPCFFGKPSWPNLFEKVQKDHAGSKVGVFVCGPPALATEIKGVCKTYSMKNHEKEFSAEEKPCHFVFHKENF